MPKSPQWRNSGKWDACVSISQKWVPTKDLVVADGVCQSSTMPLASTWFVRDLPVLESIVSYFEEVGVASFPQLSDIAERTGISIDEVTRAAQNLDGVYIQLEKVMGPSNNWHVSQVFPDARIATGQWPSPELLSDQIISALENQAESEKDPVRQTLLRDSVKILGEVIKDVGTNVLTEVIVRSMR